MIKLKDILNEDRFDQSKMFDNSTVKKIANEIKKMIKFEDGYNASFAYKEFRFGDGTGGFSFNWEHSRHKGGNFGLSLGKSGKHYMYCSSWYDKKYTGITSSPGKHFKFKGDPVEWRDFNNDHLLAIWKKGKPMIVKNEKGAQADLDKEAKAQADYYGSKAKTGRIGYGLTSQPRRGR
jgi:hypothetical protein